MLATLASILRSRAALELEILALRHQIGVLQRSDGFRLFWTWKVWRAQPGRPIISREVRDLIRKMCRENPLWGAPRIHGELLKLGVNIAESSVSKYMVRRNKVPSQNWRTFLENHAQQLVSIDFLTVPTIRFQVLYVFLALAHDRRRILHFNVTPHPTAEWAGQQLREAFPFAQLPRYLLRDRDAIFGQDFRKQVLDMGICEVLSAPRSPWQRAYVERYSAASCPPRAVNANMQEFSDSVIGLSILARAPGPFFGVAFHCTKTSLPCPTKPTVADNRTCNRLILCAPVGDLPSVTETASLPTSK